MASNDMEHHQYIRFVMLCDIEWSEVELRENLERFLLTALRGERPTQDNYPECDFYIEGSMHQFNGEVVMYLFLCDMAQQIVRVTAKRRFKTERNAEEMAHECINQLWARFHA